MPPDTLEQKEISDNVFRIFRADIREAKKIASEVKREYEAHTKMTVEFRSEFFCQVLWKYIYGLYNTALLRGEYIKFVEIVYPFIEDYMPDDEHTEKILEQVRNIGFDRMSLEESIHWNRVYREQGQEYEKWCYPNNNYSINMANKNCRLMHPLLHPDFTFLELNENCIRYLQLIFLILRTKNGVLPYKFDDYRKKYKITNNSVQRFSREQVEEIRRKTLLHGKPESWWKKLIGFFNRKKKA